MKITKFFILVAVIGTFSFCSSSDDSESLDNVPNGEIVPIEQREITLTGFSENQQSGESQKWWTHVVTKVVLSGPDECGENQTINNQGYFAFYTNGGLYYKSSSSSSPISAGSWEWANSNKTSILVSNQSGEQDFSVTYLNDSNVVYGSVQSQGPCSATTYEQFNNPFFE